MWETGIDCFAQGGLFVRIGHKKNIDHTYGFSVIKRNLSQQAEFETENADEINTILQSYSINGVSAQFGSSWNVFTDKGVAMKRDVYALLCQTGLCCRLAR